MNGTRRMLVWLVLGGVAMFLLVTHREEAVQVARTLRRGVPGWLLVAAGLQGIYFVAQATLWQRSLAAVGVCYRLADLVPVWFASIFAGTVVPASGPAVFFVDGARRGVSPARMTAALLLVNLADLGSLLLLVCGTVAYLKTQGDLHPYTVFATLILALLVLVRAGLLVGGKLRPRLLQSLLGALAKPVNAVAARFRRPAPLTADWPARTAGEFAESAALLSERRRLLGPFAVGLGAHLIDATSLWAVCHAFHVNVPLGALLSAFAVGILFWVVSITPQGVGVVEGVMAATLTAFGIPLATATSIALVFRALTLYLPLVVGVFFARRFTEGAITPLPVRS